ncbi:GNAT family N-acetyltransferase [Nonomuraea sp. 3N208]|uniref:GNAT family N-acetyltransferase n=1 Tax=Nonomuraea sp. 3N208 TaxID=3457421 RepID=UPI003FD54066
MTPRSALSTTADDSPVGGISMEQLPAALAEGIEAELMYRFVSMAPSAIKSRLAIATTRVGGGVALSVHNDPTGFWSKALGFGFEEPVTADLIGRLVDFYLTQDSRGAVIQLAPSVLPPEGFAEMMAATIDDPDFHPFAAWEGDKMIGTANLFVLGEVGSLNAAGTLPDHRNQGAQSALLAVRAKQAANAGCRWLVAFGADHSRADLWPMSAALAQLTAIAAPARVTSLACLSVGHPGSVGSAGLEQRERSTDCSSTSSRPLTGQRPDRRAAQQLRVGLSSALVRSVEFAVPEVFADAVYAGEQVAAVGGEGEIEAFGGGFLRGGAAAVGDVDGSLKFARARVSAQVVDGLVEEQPQGLGRIGVGVFDDEPAAGEGAGGQLGGPGEVPQGLAYGVGEFRL